jgi:hypothetical protein
MARASSAGNHSACLEDIVKYVGREAAAGLDLQYQQAVAAVAVQIERDLLLRGGLHQNTPRIIPDRRYQIKELEQFGFKKGRFYKEYKHLIRKDGRKSYVMGHDLLALNQNAPTLASIPPQRAPQIRRPRGRPRKVVGENDSQPKP